MPIRDWSTNNDETNGTADAASGINWAENQEPDTVNNSSRSEMAETRKWYDDLSGISDSTGTGAAYAVTTSQAIVLPLRRGDSVVFKAHTTNTGACTLNLNGTGGAVWRARAGVEHTAGQIQAGQVVGAYWDGTQFLSMNLQAGTTTIDNLDANTRGLLRKVGDVFPFFGDEGSVPAGYIICDGQAISRSTYSQLFALWGTRFGVGDGSTTFNIVDLRGEFLRGLDTTGTKDPDATSRTNRGDGTGGPVPGSKQSWATEDHNHPQAGTGNANAGDPQGQNAVLKDGGNTGGIRVTPASGALVDPVNVSTETRPRNIACYFIVLADAAAAGAQSTYVAGLSGFRFTYNGVNQDTTQDPGTGQFTLNTTDLGTFTEIAVDDQVADTGNADIRSVIDTWAAGGTLKLARSAGDEIFVQAVIQGTAGQTGFTRITFPATKDGFNGAFQNGESVSFLYTPPGTPGPQGDAGADGVDGGQPWNFSDNTDTTVDPGAGNFRINAAGDQIAIHGTSSSGSSVMEWLRTWDNSTTTGDKGQIDVKLRSDPGANFTNYRITGSGTDNTTWMQFPIAATSAAGTIANGANCSVQFARTGNEGGATGGEANRLLNRGAGVALGLDATSTAPNLPIRSLIGTAPISAAATGGAGSETATYSLDTNGLTPVTALADGDFLLATLSGSNNHRTITAKAHRDNLVTKSLRWTAAQTNEVTEIATWSTAWDAVDSNSFNITATVSGAAGNLPVPTSTHLVNGTEQVGVISFTTAAGTTAGFDASWQIAENVSTDLTTAGNYEATYRIWRNSGGTTVYRINGIVRFS